MRAWVERFITEVQNSVWYVTSLLVLAFVSVGLLILEWTIPQTDLVELWQTTDRVIAYIFLLDFFLGWFFNTRYGSKRAYWRDNWLNLVASIPITSEVTSVLRTLRVVRAIRVLRALRAGLEVTMAEKRRREVR